MARLVVLLRGINVGGAKRVAMADLRALLEDLGYGDVATVLQSGNAVVTTGASSAAAEAAIERAIADRLGLEVAVIVRTGGQLAKIVAADRLGDVADDPAKRMVIFLPATASRSAVRALRQQDLGDERVEAAGPRGLRLVPGRDRPQPPDGRDRQDRPGPERHRPQLADGHQARRARGGRLSQSSASGLRSRNSIR